MLVGGTPIGAFENDEQLGRNAILVHGLTRDQECHVGQTDPIVSSAKRRTTRGSR